MSNYVNFNIEKLFYIKLEIKLNKLIDLDSTNKNIKIYFFYEKFF